MTAAPTTDCLGTDPKIVQRLERMERAIALQGETIRTLMAAVRDLDVPRKTLADWQDLWAGRL